MYVTNGDLWRVLHDPVQLVRHNPSCGARHSRSEAPCPGKVGARVGTDRAAAIHAPAAAAMTFGVLGNHLRFEAEPPHPRPPQIIHHPMSRQRSRRLPSGLRGSGLTSITTSTRSMRPRGHLRLDA